MRATCVCGSSFLSQRWCVDVESVVTIRSPKTKNRKLKKWKNTLPGSLWSQSWYSPYTIRHSMLLSHEITSRIIYGCQITGKYRGSVLRSLTYHQSIFKRYHSDKHFSEFLPTRILSHHIFAKYQTGWLGSRVVSVLDSGAEGSGFKSQSRRCPVTVLGKLFTPIVPLFTKQQNW